MKVLDSDILIGVLRKNEDAIKKYDGMKEEIATTIFNVQEVLFGAMISERASSNFHYAKTMLDEVDILAYDKDGMMQSVKIQARLEKSGNRIGVMDEMIAGICLSRKAIIVTRNIKHFLMVPNMRVERW